MVIIVMWTLWILPQGWPWFPFLSSLSFFSFSFHSLVPLSILSFIFLSSRFSVYPLLPLAILNFSLLSSPFSVYSQFFLSILSFLCLSSRSSFYKHYCHQFIFSLRFVHRFDSSTRRMCWPILTSTRGHFAFIPAQWWPFRYIGR